MPPKRMTANPIQAPRYRPGKAIGNEDSSSDSEGEDEEEPSSQQTAKPTPKFSSAGTIVSKLSKIDIYERRKEAAAQEAARVEEEKARRAAEEEGFVTEDDEESESSEEGSDEESSEEESGSEEEAPRRVLLRPKFIPKSKRNGLGGPVIDARTDEEKLADEEKQRKDRADEVVREQIRKDEELKAAGLKYFDDEKEEGGNDVDDTDGLDPEAEEAAWKLRELKRIKRSRDAAEQREKELEELERRKNLTEEERKVEDDKYIAKQKEEKDSKGSLGYMQKSYHGGAFFQERAQELGLAQRDIIGARFADDPKNREILPQALQMRDMTKIGKRGATKYKDLKSEDTGRWGQFDDRRPGKGGFGGGGFGTDERFMPDRDRGGASGANSQPVAERKRAVDAPDGPRAMRERGDKTRDEGDWPRHGGDNYRPSEHRSQSRSRSPRGDRYGDDRSRRKRSSSRDRDRHETDKRRRVDSR